MYDKTTIALTVAAGILLLIVNLVYINLPLLSIVAVILIFGVPLSLEYLKYKEIKEIEERFPDFLTDISENMKAGMTLPRAFQEVEKNNYGILSKYVKKMAVKIDWGIPFDKVIREFSNVGGLTVRRICTSVIEAYESGGDISKILDRVVNAMNEIVKIKEERQSLLYSQMLTGYIIFFVFLGVLVSLKSFLIPNISLFGMPGGTNVSALYKGAIFYLVIIQGFFSGIVIGKLAEGRMRAGLKHSLILVLIGYLVFTLF